MARIAARTIKFGPVTNGMQVYRNIAAHLVRGDPVLIDWHSEVAPPGHSGHYFIEFTPVPGGAEGGAILAVSLLMYGRLVFGGDFSETGMDTTGEYLRKQLGVRVHAAEPMAHLINGILRAMVRIESGE